MTVRIGIDLVYLAPGATGGTETYARAVLPRLVAQWPEARFTVFCGRELGSELRGRPWAPGVKVVTLPVSSNTRIRRKIVTRLMPKSRDPVRDAIRQIARVDSALALNAPFVVLHDVRDMPHVDDARRCEFMRELDARRPQVEAMLLGYAALVGSPLERGIVTAFAWFARLPVPVRLFAREVEASAWLDTRLTSTRRSLTAP